METTAQTDVTVEDATAVAVQAIRDALRAAEAADAAPTSAPPDPPAAAASGAAVGHGPIRLRGQLPRPTLAPGETGPIPVTAAAAGSFGHGAIRLRRPAPAPVQAPAEPAGHGPIRLVERKAAIDPAATLSAREEILSALDAAGDI